MSIPVDILLGVPDPEVAPETFTEALDQIRALLSASLADFSPYIVQSSAPGVDDQDKIWQRTETDGRFVGTYLFYNGFWVLPVPPLGARIGYYSGDPTGQFDGTGLGLPGDGPVALDAYGWAICNGQNQTPNFSDRFLIGGRLDNNGFTGWDPELEVWRSNITGGPETVGGVTEITLDASTTFQPAKDAIRAAHYSAQENARDDTGGIYGKVGSNDTQGDPFDLVPADAGNETPTAISVVNPYYALAIIQWVGYPTA